MTQKVTQAVLEQSIAIARTRSRGWLWLFALLVCALCYLVCLLATTLPLYNNPIYPLASHAWITLKIIHLASKIPLPQNLGLDPDPVRSAHITNFWVFTLLIAAMFVAYGLSAIFILRYKRQAHMKYILVFIFMITIIAGYIYVFTPGTLSEDVYLYSNYGRILSIHHANPYFDPPATFPQDPSYPFVYWKNIVSVYGPVWLLVCAFLVRVSGTSPFGYFLAFRLFALALHLLNALLIAAILRTAGRSKRIIVVGTLLYAWNPLVIFEGCVGGHNDIFMATFVLVGILLAVRVEKRQDTTFRHYIPTLIAFTMALLVKLTILPILPIFIAMLVVLRYRSSSSLSLKRRFLPIWRAVLITLGLASIVCAAMVGLFYGPFWLGHPLSAILYSFSSQPPDGHAFNSLLAALQIWDKVYPLPHVLTPLLTYGLWNDLTVSLLILIFLVGAIRLWHAPTIRNVVLSTLVSLSALLLTTNWFLPWYVTSLVCLASICLPITGNRWNRAIVAFTFTLSATAFFAYYYNFIGTYYIHFQLADSWKLVLAYVLQFALPLLVFLALLIFYPRRIREKY